jgi:hypothetical protein
MSKEKYILEYWVDSNAFSKESLEQKISQELGDLEVQFLIDDKESYLSLSIKADAKNIDACHDRLNFDRENIFRVKDELGDQLRSKAYPILAEIETRLRKFISSTMIEVLGFSWWDTSISETIQENVNEIESRTESKEARFHHPIEFTMFDDLINIVTHSFQRWPDEKEITVSDLEELLKECDSIEKLSKELAKKRETISIWENVFSNYFDDKEAWSKLENKIEDIVIPIRNKVMHHRHMRRHELRQLKACRDDLNNILRVAKSELSSADVREAIENMMIVFKNFRVKIDPEVFKLNINQEWIENFQKPLIDPEVIKSLQQPIIDPEILKRLMIPKFNFGIQDFDTKSGSGEDSKEDQNGNDESDQDEDDKSEEDENEDDSSEDDKNCENDKS